ncbi:MAG: hypothetical protein WCC08_21345 [Terrimicrobiaceae bacterium]
MLLSAAYDLTAEEELQRLKIKARRHGQAGLDIPDELRGMAAECARQLAPYGKTIRDAMAFYVSHLTAAESAQIDQLVDDYLRGRQRSQLSAHYLIDITARLSRFKEDFRARPVRTIVAREIEEWLYSRTLANGHDLSPQTAVNARAILHAFFAWLLRQKLIDFNPVEAVPKPKVVRGAPAIWAPADLEPFAIAQIGRVLPIAPSALSYARSPPRRRRPLPAVGSVINATTPARVVAP